MPRFSVDIYISIYAYGHAVDGGYSRYGGQYGLLHCVEIPTAVHHNARHHNNVLMYSAMCSATAQKQEPAATVQWKLL